LYVTDTLRPFIRVVLLIGFALTSSSSFAQFEFEADLGADLMQENPNTFVFETQYPIPFTTEMEERGLFSRLIKNASNFEFKLKNTPLKDELGQEHRRYLTFRDGFRLHGVELILHIKNAEILAVSGWHFATEVLPDLTRRIDEAVAIAEAIKFVGADSYMWEHEEEEALLQRWMNDPLATYQPKAKKVIIPQSWEYPSSKLRPAYEIQIYSSDPVRKLNVFVDMETGEILSTEDLLHPSDAEGRAETAYSGTQRITTDSLSPTSYRLRESGRGKGIETYNMLTGTRYGSAVDFTDSNNYWNNKNANQDEIATDAHWGAEQTYDYFWNKFGRKSFDDKDAKIRSYVHYGKKYNNAFWNGVVMTYGDGDGRVFTPLTSIDVCAHEIAHAVTTNSAALIYQYESGALNESFSDIFGNSVEAYAKPTDSYWNIGEDITPSGTGIRLMQNPNAKRHPDTYKGTNWRTGPADNGGVHSNSGVQNFWYYLLCEGGSGTNDNSENYTVQKIGMNKAEQIAYRNLTVYLTSSSQYVDARFFAIRSAADLYGDCSDEVIAVTNAWHAVGVGAPYDSAVVVADFYADTAFCAPDADVQFVNRSSNAKGYQWSFGDGGSSTAWSPKHTYQAFGQFNVRLIAEGCFHNKYDTLVKSNYIVVDSNFDICNAYIMPVGTYDTVRACRGFIYDNGGEENYITRVRDTLTIDAFPCDSLVFDFTVFEYENKYDSVYIYDGPSTSSPLVGGYTGNTLPGGGRIVTTSGYATIRHFSDPYVVGDGFKASFTAYRDSVELSTSNDTTVCKGAVLQLFAKGTGGYGPDLRYWWNGKAGDTAVTLIAEKDTDIVVMFGDICLEDYVYDTIHVTVTPALDIEIPPDTTLCYLQTGVFIDVNTSGGIPSQHQIRWLHDGSTSDPLPFTPQKDTTLRVELSDGCTAEPDTARIAITVLDPISVNVSSGALLCEGQILQMKARASGGKQPLSFAWSHSLGFDSVATNLQGVDTTYRVITSDGCSGESDTSYVEMRYREPLELEISNDTVICFGTLAEISATAKGGDTTNYSFKWSDGLDPVYLHRVSPTIAERYAVTLTDGCSQTEQIDSVLVVVYQELKISIDAKDTVCYGERLFLQGRVTGGRTSSYQFIWRDGLGNSPNANSNPAVDTTYRLVISDGCSENDTAYHRVVVLDSLSITHSGDTEICEGDTILVSASGAGGRTSDHNFFWNNGLGTGASHRISPNFTTNYTITLNDGCSNFSESNLRVVVNTTPNVAFYPDSRKKCLGQAIQFTNSTTNTNGADFMWDFGDGNGSTEESPLYEYLSTGHFDVTLTITTQENCEAFYTSDSLVEILPAPVALFDYSPSSIVILDPLVRFTNLSQNSNVYSWNYGDGNGSSALDPSHSYTDTGTYLVQLRSENEIGCFDEYSEWIQVKDVVLLHVPNAFSPNTDALNDLYKPFARGIRNYTFEIYDRWGERLFSTSDLNGGWDGNYKGEKAQPGIYFFKVEGLDIDRNKVTDSGTFYLLR